ncbi:hypothetical protein GA0115253_1057512 [Streptomyces sp. Termitarium-T10T-6]|nr:hypothetical protein GA0115253_1057512 [Streptomyces sp. Termitarium-T10T-6]
MGLEHDRGSRPDQALRREDGRGRPFLPGAAGGRHRLPRSQRVGQVHDDAHDPRPGPPHRRSCHHRRPPLPQSAERAAPGRRAAGRQGRARRPHRPQPPAVPGSAGRDPCGPGRRGPRRGRPPGRRQAALQRLLARDGAAARDRGGAAGRSAGAAVRRAGQRSRPGGHPLGPQSDEVARLRGTHGLRLVPPDERDGPHRRPSDRDRARPAALRHERHGLHLRQLRRLRPGPGARGRPRGPAEADGHAHRGGGPGPVGAGRGPAGHRAAAAEDQRPGPRLRRTALGAVPAPGVAGGGLHAPHAGPGGLPLDGRRQGGARGTAAPGRVRLSGRRPRRGVRRAGGGAAGGLVRPAAAGSTPGPGPLAPPPPPSQTPSPVAGPVPAAEPSSAAPAGEQTSKDPR